VGAELFHADGRTDGRAHRHDEANNCFSQFCESAQKLYWKKLHISLSNSELPTFLLTAILRKVMTISLACDSELGDYVLDWMPNLPVACIIYLNAAISALELHGLSLLFLRRFARGVKRLGRESDHSSPTSAEVKNEGSCTSTSLYTFMACTGTTCPYFTLLYLFRHFISMTNVPPRSFETSEQINYTTQRKHLEDHHLSISGGYKYICICIRVVSTN
jgi:hypothetical protein